MILVSYKIELTIPQQVKIVGIRSALSLFLTLDNGREWLLDTRSKKKGKKKAAFQQAV